MCHVVEQNPDAETPSIRFYDLEYPRGHVTTARTVRRHCRSVLGTRLAQFELHRCPTVQCERLFQFRSRDSRCDGPDGHALQDLVHPPADHFRGRPAQEFLGALIPKHNVSRRIGDNQPVCQASQHTNRPLGPVRLRALVPQHPPPFLVGPQRCNGDYTTTRTICSKPAPKKRRPFERSPRCLLADLVCGLNGGAANSNCSASHSHSGAPPGSRCAVFPSLPFRSGGCARV